ncbi:MAG: hypothetical protein IT267_06655 [Saprospiraceae bacterium]|nr:hypothetical protein [Saprospiraceae bacterium]
MEKEASQYDLFLQEVLRISKTLKQLRTRKLLFNPDSGTLFTVRDWTTDNLLQIGWSVYSGLMGLITRD